MTPPFEIVAPPFHVWFPGYCIHPILFFKNMAPPSGFWPTLLLNPGDGPEYERLAHAKSCHTVCSATIYR